MSKQKKYSALFVSHGAPTLALDEGAAAYQFLKELGNTLEKPRAILVVSAHWLNPLPTVSLVEKPETIHDFGGFPEALFNIEYPAPGATDLADHIDKLLRGAGIESAVSNHRGLDHGAWVPLSLMYPLADIPVTQLSLKEKGNAVEHFKIGQSLSPLREEGVLILASGSAVHNLRYLSAEAKPLNWAEKFDDFLYRNILDGRRDELLNFRASSPDSWLAHPTDEHLLPLFVAMGASGLDEDHPGTCLHRSWTFGSLSMAAYGFNAP